MFLDHITNVCWWCQHFWWEWTMILDNSLPFNFQIRKPILDDFPYRWNDEVPRNHRHFTSSRSQASLTGRGLVVDLRSQRSRVAHKKPSSASIEMKLFSKFCPGGCYKESRVDMARNTGLAMGTNNFIGILIEWNEEISPIIRNKRNKDEKNKTKK